MPQAVPPSLFLPPLGRDLSRHTSLSLLEHVHVLGKIFLPPILGSGTESPAVQPSTSTDTPDHRTSAEKSLTASKSQVTPQGEEEYEVLRYDEYEQGVARAWLMKVVKRGEEWIEEVDEELEEAERLRREEVVEGSAALLAVWSGTSAAGAILRTLQLPREIVLNINDAAYSSQSPDSVGVQTWGSSILFARRIASSPSSFGLLSSTTQRILELGAGTGVVSMTIAAIPFPTPVSPLIQTTSLPSYSFTPSSSSTPSAPLLPIEANPRRLVLATDHHPLVLTNLRSNVNLNFPPDKVQEDAARRIEVHGLDWLQFHEGEYEETIGRDGARKKADVKRVETMEPPFEERFDVIFGADIVYEAHHAPWIFDTVSHFLAYPHFPSSTTSYDTHPLSASSATYLPSFHLWAPLRPTHTAEIDSIEATFPLAETLEPRRGRTQEELAWRLAVVEEERLVRVEGVGRKDETMYRRWRIAWV